MAFAIKPKKPKKMLDAVGLYEYAVRQLASKMRTVAVLKRLMRRHVEPGEAGETIIDAVIIKLKQQNYLNDTRFAQDYTRMRQENEKFGKRRVQQQTDPSQWLVPIRSNKGRFRVIWIETSAQRCCVCASSDQRSGSKTMRVP